MPEYRIPNISNHKLAHRSPHPGLFIVHSHDNGVISFPLKLMVEISVEAAASSHRLVIDTLNNTAISMLAVLVRD